MKSRNQNRTQRRAGSALMMTLVMSGVGLLVLAGAMSWCATNTKLTDRSNRYARAVTAGESAIEKVLTQMNTDFYDGGQGMVDHNLSAYRASVPTSSDSSYWSTWEFNNAIGQVGQTYVQPGVVSNYVVLTGAYAGLNGYVSSYTLVSNAREVNSIQNVVAGVMEQVQL